MGRGVRDLVKKSVEELEDGEEERGAEGGEGTVLVGEGEGGGGEEEGEALEGFEASSVGGGREERVRIRIRVLKNP